MPVARIVTRLATDVEPLRRYLRRAGYTVEVVEPGDVRHAPVDLEVDVESCGVDQALVRATELARAYQADIYVAPGLYNTRIERSPEAEFVAEKPADAEEGEPETAPVEKTAFSLASDAAGSVKVALQEARQHAGETLQTYKAQARKAERTIIAPYLAWKQRREIRRQEWQAQRVQAEQQRHALEEQRLAERQRIEEEQRRERNRTEEQRRAAQQAALAAEQERQRRDAEWRQAERLAGARRKQELQAERRQEANVLRERRRQQEAERQQAMAIAAQRKQAEEEQLRTEALEALRRREEERDAQRRAEAAAAQARRQQLELEQQHREAERRRLEQVAAAQRRRDEEERLRRAVELAEARKREEHERERRRAEEALATQQKESRWPAFDSHLPVHSDAYVPPAHGLPHPEAYGIPTVVSARASYRDQVWRTAAIVACAIALGVVLGASFAPRLRPVSPMSGINAQPTNLKQEVPFGPATVTPVKAEAEHQLAPVAPTKAAKSAKPSPARTAPRSAVRDVANEDEDIADSVVVRHYQPRPNYRKAQVRAGVRRVSDMD